jgi:hypothetical protein
MNQIYFVTAALLVAAAPARAQGCSHTPDDADEERVELAPTFYDSDPADPAVRGNAIQQLSASDTNYVVHDDSVCDLVLARAIQYVRGVDSTWARGAEGDYVASVFGFGPYYVASISAEQPAATYANGTLSMGSPAGASWQIVLRPEDLEIVRVFS